MKSAFENTILNYLPYIDHLAYIDDIYENGRTKYHNITANSYDKHYNNKFLLKIVINKKEGDSTKFKEPIGYKFVFDGEESIDYIGIKIYPFERIYIGNFYPECDKKIQKAIDDRLLEIGKEQFTMYKLMKE